MSDGPADLERLREALARADETARAGSGCPQPEQIWAAVSGQAAPEVVQKLLEHGATCAACGKAWRLAADLLHASSGEAAPGAPVTRFGRAWSFWAAAAAILLLGAVALMLPPRTAIHDATFRSRPGESIDSLIPDMVGLPRTGVLLRWSPAAGAARYRVTVATPELVTVHVSGWLPQPELVVPESALENLPAGQVLVWTVEAVLEDGRQIASPAFLVQLE